MQEIPWYIILIIWINPGIFSVEPFREKTHTRKWILKCDLQNVSHFVPFSICCGLRMRRECRERFPRHRLQWKPPVSDPGMHRGTCVTHVTWCMSGSLNRDGGENVPGIPGACATGNFTYVARGPCIYRGESLSSSHCRAIRIVDLPMTCKSQWTMLACRIVRLNRQYTDFMMMKMIRWGNNQGPVSIQRPTFRLKDSHYIEIEWFWDCLLF